MTDDTPESSRNALEEKERELREQQRELRRQHFVDAAERCFLSEGVGNTTMEDVAREAGFSVGMIYQYFDHKEELCVAIGERINEQLIEEVDDILSRESLGVEKTLRRLVREIFSFWEENTEILEIFYTEPAPNTLNTQGLTNALFSRYTETFRELFGRWVREGRLEGNPVALTHFLWGMIASKIVYWSVQGHTPGLTEHADPFVDHFLRGTQRGPQAR